MLSLVGFLVLCQGGAMVLRDLHRHGRQAEATRVTEAERAEASTSASLWGACLEEDSADQRFWAAEWAAQEAALLRLEYAAGGANTTKEVNQTAGLEKHRKSPLSGLKLNLNPTSTADLVPALAMLKSLYEDGKERIAKLNVREKESKQRFAEKEATHTARLERIEARFKNRTLSAEFKANETKDENRLWSYWQRVRERQHRQYHTSLKIQHGTMEKVKAMINMYEKTMSGKADKGQVQKELAKVAGGVVPEVVLLQDTRRDAGRYCLLALEEVRRARADLFLPLVRAPQRLRAAAAKV